MQKAASIDPALLRRLGCPFDKLKNLCNKYGVAELSIFGSATRDDFDPQRSDIDLLVVFNADSKLDLGGYYELEERLSELVHRKVDLVSKNGLRPHWRETIVPTAKLLCG